MPESSTQGRSSVIHPSSLNTIGELAAGIAHEIKTPAQYVGDNVRFLQEAFVDVVNLLAEYRRIAAAKSPELALELCTADANVDVEYLMAEVPRAIDQSLEGLARISAIVLAIKELSHPDRDRRVSTDVNRLASTSATVCGSEWRLVAELKLTLAEGLPLLDCCPGPISQVVINLLVNAAHAIAALGGHEKGCITLSTAQVSQGIEVRVRDTGSGIPEAVRSRIFEQHFTTKPTGQGTGQGLHIARQIIQTQHQGRLWFETELNVGTCFAFWLPIKAPNAS